MCNISIEYIFNFMNNKNICEIKRKVGNLNDKEIISLIKSMEKEFEFSNKKCLEDDIFIVIAKSINDRIYNSKNFNDYKQLKYNLEKINWIRKKNIYKEYNDKEEELFKEIIAINPDIKEKIMELMDLENERETKLITCINF